MRITLRLPAALHAWLAAEAKKARRSLNSEILHRLEVQRGNPRQMMNRPDGDVPVS
ncbi:Arc family DNA-binding protein [Streptomyces sp. RKAG293]|uniref:Arc family DNA-binding protein n=1 Tax=Streptomyces sp. RKAG293 TaxID=2893403 RepID=UPI0035A961E4